MPTYAEMDNVQLAALKEELEREYGEIKARGLALNMARGKPAKAQLDLSMPLLETVTTMEDCVAAAGADCLEIEVHDDPKHAWSDGAQALTPAQFRDAMARIAKVREAVTMEVE